MASNSAPASPRPRPLSPHLQIYRWHWSMFFSILHRATGVALAVGFPLWVGWLWTAAYMPDLHRELMQHARHEVLIRYVSITPFMVLLMGWSFAFYYHFLAGIRHLFWDAGVGFEIRDARRSGYVVMFGALLATAVTWCIV